MAGARDLVHIAELKENVVAPLGRSFGKTTEFDPPPVDQPRTALPKPVG